MEENSCQAEPITSLRVSYLYDKNLQRFCATIAWFPFGRNTIVELCDRYSCQLICQLLKKK